MLILTLLAVLVILSLFSFPSAAQALQDYLRSSNSGRWSDLPLHFRFGATIIFFKHKSREMGHNIPLSISTTE